MRPKTVIMFTVFIKRLLDQNANYISLQVLLFHLNMEVCILRYFFRKGDLDSNSFMELTELVHKGEKKGIFMDEMPASIHQIIQAENLTFVKNRDVYNTDYFRFIRDLVAVNMVIITVVYSW